mmetsp:Transcript_123603/g.246025  ORF Transcript_123603/g.246025 Transcript_123603/m.246025 type:complete len:776 (-) Transcript_123603:72-2399(-)
MPGAASSGKRSIKHTAASYQGVSASQHVHAAESSGQLASSAGWSSDARAQQPPQSYIPAWPYIAFVTEDGGPDGPRYPKCLLCQKWCQDETSHTGTQAAPSGSKEHQKNLRNRLPGDPWYEEHVVKVRQIWHPDLAAAASSRPQQPAAEEEPWIELREAGRYCMACHKFSTPEHQQTENHLWRVQHWGQDDIVAKDPWLQMRNGELFCLACSKFATSEHLETAKHMWRAQVWAASGSAGADPGDIVAAVIKAVPLRKKSTRRGSSEKEATFVLESLDADMSPVAVGKDDFQSWPLPPRVNDVLLLAATSSVGAAGVAVPPTEPQQVRPRLKEIGPLSTAELVTLTKRLETLCQKNFEETCTAMVAEYYQYIRYALNAEALDVVVPLLRVLKRCAQEAVAEPAEGRAALATRVLLLDAVRSTVVGVTAPQLVVRGLADVALCQELVCLLIDFIPSGLSRLKPLMQASCERRLKEAAQEVIPDMVEEFPPHWSTPAMSFTKQIWTAVPLEEGGAVFNALLEALVTDPSELQKRGYSELGLKRAWRIENPGLMDSYMRERNCVRKQRYEIELRSLPKASFRQSRLVMPLVGIRQTLCTALEGLPGELSQDVNEVRLLARARPEDVLCFAGEGLHPKANAGQFGKGSHLVEDAGDCDQHAICDFSGKNKELKTMHARLFTKTANHPGNMYYIFVCRVVLGYFVRSSTGDADARAMDEDGPVYAAGDKRALAHIPSTAPPVPYQSLIVEVGEQLRRYRQFIQFESRRIYPEYLLGYQRNS